MAIHGFSRVDRRLGYVRVQTEHELTYYRRLCDFERLTEGLDKAEEAWFTGTINHGIHVRIWLPSDIAVPTYHLDAIAAAIKDSEESGEPRAEDVRGIRSAKLHIRRV